MIKSLSPFFLLLLLAVSFSACEDDDDPEPITDDVPGNVTGLNYAEYRGQTFASVYSPLLEALNANLNISVAAEIDHQANAAGIGTTIDPTTVVYFGNPQLGTPLMLANQRAGIDLPQKMLVYQAEDDDIIVAYNNTSYLANRHGVGNVSTLPMISTALTNFATTMGATTETIAERSAVTVNEGLIELTSQNTVAETVAKLKQVIDSNPNLSLITEVDHQQNAAMFFMTLRPTYLVVFGNPNLGTPLIENERTIGLDLPQKMLVFEEENGDVKVVYNDIDYLVARHGVTGVEEQVTMIRGALANIAGMITQP
ncbi:DUF302 domain-containing protein [Lewinella sp. 4G2]|uniref:DUF302 domain-containing protein n=1 Tax=Lewinella sp. 4G2 TaxID=1803372 RepID=UPI0007E07719|nr:DUF302 domain-containing protein [Lewinella sp. 4G2]OAV43556.1 hypothetical protein A3850_003180 [Lewinella sp. 4G2]